MRYYNIEEINNNSKKSRFKWPLILTVASIVISCGLFVGGIWATQQAAAATTQAEEAKLLNEKSQASHDTKLGDTLRKSSVAKVSEGEEIETYSISEVRNLDVSKPSGVTVADLKLVTRGNFVGLEEAFWKAEQDYGINCLFLMAIGANESAYGTKCFRKNNMFGFGRKGFDTKADCIDTVANTLANKYLNPRGSLYHGKTIDGVHRSYAASPTWDDHVAKYMVSFYKTIAPKHNESIEALK